MKREIGNRFTADSYMTQDQLDCVSGISYNGRQLDSNEVLKFLNDLDLECERLDKMNMQLLQTNSDLADSIREKSNDKPSDCELLMSYKKMVETICKDTYKERNNGVAGFGMNNLGFIDFCRKLGVKIP